MDPRTLLKRIPALVCILLMGASAIGQAPTSQQNPGSLDGPAELPRIYVRSSLADTPAQGPVRHLKESDDLQKALNEASCGETVELQAGSTYRGLFRVPAKKCDDAHWIIIRTSASGDDLPPEGTRLKPCYAGVGELQGRPPFRCAQARNVMARIEFDGKNGSGPLMLEDGANHIRFIGLEITRTAPNATVYNLISLENRGTADHIVFDRVWIHGTTHDETTRGILLGGSTYVAIVDSFFSDFHCTARTGACVDSQAIAGGIGEHPMGPYKIVNNFIEGAAEGILFGGGPATASPSDIEIRNNYIFKPLIWRPGNPTFVARTWVRTSMRSPCIPLTSSKTASPNTKRSVFRVPKHYEGVISIRSMFTSLPSRVLFLAHNLASKSKR